MFTITYNIEDKDFATKVLTTTEIDATIDEIVDFLRWVEKTRGSEGLMDIYTSTLGARIEFIWEEYKKATSE